MRAGAVGLILAMAACSPAPQPVATTEIAADPESAPVADADAATREALSAALAETLAVDLAQPVSLGIETARVQDEYAWVIAFPQQPSGAPIDYTTTRYAPQVASDTFDGDGLTYALLQREGRAWAVRAFVVGPTDVAYLDWPERYGAPRALLGLD